MPASAANADTAASSTTTAGSSSTSSAAAAIGAARPNARLPGGIFYVSADMPGYTRVKAGDGFRYRKPDGSWLEDTDEEARIRSLAIPPAYTDVWICSRANGHLQAVGLDARGRKQYRYHPQWRALRDGDKFERLQAFGEALPRIRARVARDIAGGGKRDAPLTRERVLATLVRLLDTTFMRIGNAEYARDNDSYGLTTLRNPHAGVRGSVLRLRFRGKSGVQHSVTLNDPRVAAVVRRCQQLPGQELFQYEDDAGRPHTLGSADVNAYLAQSVAPRRAKSAAHDGSDATDATGIADVTAAAHFTAKDFRTWHGTVQALELTRAACDGSAAEAYSAKRVLAEVARQLGNTPAVCKKAYVHPAVLALGGRIAQEAEAVAALWQRIAAEPHRLRGLSAAEHRLLAFLKAQGVELKRATRIARSTGRPSARRARTSNPKPQRV